MHTQIETIILSEHHSEIKKHKKKWHSEAYHGYSTHVFDVITYLC